MKNYFTTKDNPHCTVQRDGLVFSEQGCQLWPDNLPRWRLRYLRKFDLRCKPSGTINPWQLANLRGIWVFQPEFKYNLLRPGEPGSSQADVDMGPANLANLNCFVLELCQSDLLGRTEGRQTQAGINQTIKLDNFNNFYWILQPNEKV